MSLPEGRTQSSRPFSRSGITSRALRRGELKISEPLPVSGIATVGFQPGEQQLFHVPSEPEGQTWPRRGEPPTTNYRNDSAVSDLSTLPAGPGSFERNRISAGPSIIQSMSAHPSKTSLNQRPQSGLKAAIRRLFSSRRQRSSFGEARSGYHLSDPGNLVTVSPNRFDETSIRPNTVHRQGPVTQNSALGSHSPFAPPENVKPSKWEAPSDWKTLRSRQKRRNTLPSIILSQQEAQLIARALDQSIASSDQRAAMYAAHQSQETPKALKRRSRSADALGDLAAEFESCQGHPRGREDEIAYWRNAAQYDQEFEWDPGTSPTAEGVKRLTRQVLSGENKLEVPPQNLAFDFGLPGGINDSVSLEERVNTLEVKLVDFEYAIAKLQGNFSKAPLPAKTPKRRSVHELFPEPDIPRTTSRPTQSQTFLSSPDDSPVEHTEFEESDTGQRISRTSTIRPATAQPRSRQKSRGPSPVPVTQTADHFEKILTLVRDEQAARHRLETQVGEMQKELDELRAPVYAYIRPATIPTPSPELKQTTPVTPKARVLHRTPAFQPKQRVNISEKSRFSVSEDESGISDTDDGFQDVYETPQENRFTFETTKTHHSPMSSPQIGVI